MLEGPGLPGNEPGPGPHPPTKRMAPARRGGRLRGRQKSLPAPGPRREQPELVCWKQRGQWVPGIEMPRDLLDVSDLTVSHDGSPLKHATPTETRWPLERLSGRVVFRRSENGEALIRDIAIGDDSYLLFKLDHGGHDRGRGVKSISVGWYLVMAPDTWERLPAPSSPVAVAPEPVSIDGYRAHFLIADGQGARTIGFQTPQGTEVVVPSGAPPFRLLGRRFTDAIDDMGPLLGGECPRLGSLDEHPWSDVGLVVVGEEGPRQRRRWRTTFSPVAGQSEQELPAELSNRGGGWYFVRIYDQRDSLLDSLAFRFLPGLADLRFSPYSSLPGPEGHTPVLVEFVHGAGCSVRPANDRQRGLDVRRSDQGTSFVVPADPSWDVTDWEVECPPGPAVPVGILVERIWWSLGSEGDSSTHTRWHDTPVSVTHTAFRATSSDSICIWFPKPGWARRVVVGFEQATGRAFPPKMSDKMLSVALREFGDADDLQSGAQTTSLRLWLQPTGPPEGAIPICHIVPEVSPPPPTPAQPDATPLEISCCTTCDHARTQSGRLWCRRNHWGRVTEDTFQAQFSRFLCGEWRGEYYDRDGVYHSARPRGMRQRDS